MAISKWEVSAIQDLITLARHSPLHARTFLRQRSLIDLRNMHKVALKIELQDLTKQVWEVLKTRENEKKT